MNTCITCGMPLEGEHANMIGIETPEGLVCQFDLENGEIKSPEAIFAGGITFFLTYTNGDEQLAARCTRKNMSMLPYWQTHPFDELSGEHATDEEFERIMSAIK